MYISIETPFLHSGENASRTLRVSVPAELTPGRELRLAFISPSGRALMSPVLETNNGCCDYLLPCEALDRYGRLYAQILITDTAGYCVKSDVFEFAVQPGIDEQACVTPEGRLLTLGDVDDRLRAAEQILARLQMIPITDAELAEILV